MRLPALPLGLVRRALPLAAALAAAPLLAAAAAPRAPLPFLAAEDDGAAPLPRYVGAFYFSLVTSASGPDVAVPAYDGDVYVSELVSAPGFTFGLWLEKPFGDHLAGRVAFEMSSLGGRAVDHRLYSKSYAVRQFALTCDVLLYPGGSRRLYVFGGIGCYDRFLEESFRGTQVESYGVAYGACRSLGAGAYLSRRVGLEFKRVNGDAPWSQVSLVFRS
jgi:hypothetical protein